MTKWDLSQVLEGWFNTQNSMNTIHHISKLKKKNHLIISTGAEKASDKIPHSFTTDSQYLGMGDHPQLDKEHLQRPSADSPWRDTHSFPSKITAGPWHQGLGQVSALEGPS